MKGKRILEVNPRHPLIQQVKDKFEADPDNAANGALAKLLYETALLESGFSVRTAFVCPCCCSPPPPPFLIINSFPNLSGTW